MAEIQTKLHTVCMVQRGDQVLLLNRCHDPVIQGYIAPGGKIDYPEGPLEGAVREVWEETGLRVTQVVYKGLTDYVDPAEGLRYMVFNYLATAFEGELLAHPPEGALEWVQIAEMERLPMSPWFRSRFPLFFVAGTFETHTHWDGQERQERTTRFVG